MTKRTLNEHLTQLDQNSQATQEQIDHLATRFKGIFKKLGYKNSAKDIDTLREYVDMIFECQDYRCTHWLQVAEGELNGVWNRPHAHYRGWKTKQVLYEIDHVHPVNAGGTDSLTNFQFLSANANQFVKCSLTYDDLLRRVDLSDALKDRIRYVLQRRKQLFTSERWTNFVKKLS
jgi:hypothetical protein